jgi:hypothetical protein
VKPLGLSPALLVIAGSAATQYPERPIRPVVPHSPLRRQID